MTALVKAAATGPALPDDAAVRARALRVPAVLLTCLALVAGLLVATVVLVAAGPAAEANRASEASGRPDSRLGGQACRLMGRVPTAAGCSRTRCRTPGERIRFSPNAETCLVGGRRGTAYGTEIDARVCRQLHRRWVAAVNLCATNPARGQTLTYDAPQCSGRFSVYVTASRTTGQRATRAEKEGRYDLCVQPREARRLVREASSTGRSLRTLVVGRSPALCNLQPRRTFVDGECVRRDDPVRPPTVLMVGDSLTWRGTNELAPLRPAWVIDGQSGRSLSQLAGRVERFEADRGTPTGLVVALGTNPARGYTAARLRTLLQQLPDRTPVMLVRPYRSRGPNSLAQVRQVDRADDLLTSVAESRPRTCTADWRGLVAARPGLLVDGTHQIRSAERRWARLVSSAWDACLADQPPPAAPPTAPPVTEPTEPPTTEPPAPPVTEPTEPPITETPAPPVTEPTEPPTTGSRTAPGARPTTAPTTGPTTSPTTGPTSAADEQP